MLLQYRFPGNIRQLKNLVEQMSVLSTGDRVIDAATLKHYLPQESHLPALLPSSPAEKDAISERDLLYKVLFDMKRDMVDLKKLVLDMYNNQGKGGQPVKDRPQRFDGLEHEVDKSAPEPVLLRVHSNEEPEEVQDITHETEDDDSLSIEKKERELIIRALRKNNNKRKYAARDLGISERTLYRKIKQYDLD